MEIPQELLGMLEQDAVKGESKEIASTELTQEMKKPLLKIEKDKRRGKIATLITGYEDDSEEVRELAKLLKQRLAVGGSTRDGEILLQGDVRDKLREVLKELGYKVKG